MQWKAVLIALVADLMVVSGDVFARRWASTGGLTLYLLGAVSSYLCVTTLWLVVLRMVGHLGKAGILWVATGAFIPVLVGHFGFGEVISLNLKIAMLLCGVALVLANIK